MYKLRYYQQDAIDSVFKYFETKSGNPVIASPTGVGKSLMIAGFLKEVYRRYPTQRVMMLTHVKELIEQNYEKLMAMWRTAPAGIYSAGLKRKDVHNKIIFAGIQSVAKKAELFKHVDLIIIDECHLVSPTQDTSYQKFIKALKKVNPHIKIIGLSATPYRLGLGLITNGDIFTDICYDNTDREGFNRLVDEGYIMQLIPRRTNFEIDLTGVGKRGGEFIPREVQDATDQEEVTYAALTEAVELGYDRDHWLVFGTGVEHCENIALMLDSLGVSAVVVHSKKTPAENDKAIQDFKDGKVTALVNNNKLTTGFDCPNIDMIVMLRPTDSASLWVQMLGRGTRPVYADGFDLEDLVQRLAAIAAGPKQNCLVLDFAGNTKRLGPINDPVLPRMKGSKGGGVAPVRECPKCQTLNHGSIRVCINCGHEFPLTTRIIDVAGTDELMASNMPQFVNFKVTNTIYTLHTKQDRPPSVKITTYCGLNNKFTTYMCLEHGGIAKKKALELWAARSRHEAPPTTKEALDWAHNLKVPTHVRVWVNKKYPEIMLYSFIGGEDLE